MPPERVTALVVLSPHRDDAAFSTGSLLGLAATAGLPVTVLNVFTQSMYAPFGPDGLSIDAVTSLRLSEDQAVVSLLAQSAQLLDLALLDAPLRLHIRDDQVISGSLSPEQFAAEVERTAAALPDLSHVDLLLAPLALGAHIDHLIARDAALRAVSPDRLGFYQDLPYASRMHSPKALEQETAEILAVLSSHTQLPLRPWLLHAENDAGRKRHLVSCYPSQVAPETVDEIAKWTESLGGEQLYLSDTAGGRLSALLPRDRLSRISDQGPLLR